ncbi:hypothetical protein KFL_003060110 [Klebsormidium nitens]|uniref:SAC3/GANP/THP3 conserved domain-containing protein n=1 Tax=Klebsormidium nitens TaxID=105231 RepID=A0A1Y1I9T6_KLENI|nr:hypothetical protein KFL_003060110 [Klebsormidium nitens]|eukprot:GAQ86712.1 hypothetical protein KFL_003060110 [Klebsormidium nitens]
MSLERGPRETGGKEVARGLLGTCLDMCPEKERRDRERFKDLAVFERVDGSRERTSADLAVKKFSRNAAECPEDIRPVPVLLRTMEYLLGLLDDPRGQSLATVHAFLWDRFRAIRQDLTLQHCVSPAAVRLHEQMARFHILSHYELCESSGPQVRASPPEEERFEPHMNLEQLSKTLAGLFQMYDDLHRKGGVEFRTEGEFRAYYILMQTAKSDGRVDAAAVTPLLMRLRPAVLQSCEVCFTLRAFCCARAGDYVRFFRLAAGASYLQTCILHGAFPQVRSRALQVLNKASMKGQAWPLAALSSVLSTEGEVAPSVLCLDYGLRLAEDRQGQPAVLLNEPGVIVQRPVNTVHRKARLVDGLRRLRSLRSEVECNA